MTESRWRSVPLVCPACRGGIREDEGGVLCVECSREFSCRDGILDLTLGRSGGAGYDPHFFGVLDESEERHFWFVSRRESLLGTMRRGIPDLPRRAMLDIGCGTGSLLAFLARKGVAVVGACDAYRESLALVRRRLDVPVVLVDEGRPLPVGEGLSLVGMFDVLEHIDDDTGTLRLIWNALEPGGFLALTVPAHPWLFSQMDVAAFHRRRYTRRELREKLGAAGFEVRVLSHFMMVLVPVLVLLCWIERRNPSRRPSGGRFRVIPVVNALLSALLGLERFAMRFVSLPFGSSLVAVVRRPVSAPGGEAG